jgi:probable rRNA maturation factor
MPTKATEAIPARELAIRNVQRQCRVDRDHLRFLIRHFLDHGLGLTDYCLGVHLVDRPAIVRLNQTYLRHPGATDVITFDHQATPTRNLHGELFICVPVAIEHARRYRTSWQMEVVRYLVHGILHLLGYDDRSPAARRRMKAEEDRWVRWLRPKVRFRPRARRAPGRTPGK